MTPVHRVLMVSDVSPLTIRGGAERVLWEQASRLARRGLRVRILSRSPGGDVTDAVEREGVLIRHFQVDRRSPVRFCLSSILQACRSVTRLLAEEGADILHLYQPFSGYGALRSDRAKRLPCLYTFLSPAPLEYITRSGTTEHHRSGLMGRVIQLILWGIERACVRRATRIHVLSQFSADQLRGLYRISPDRIIKIPGGVDTVRFQPAGDRQAVRRMLGIPTGSPLLLTVRNLESRMGLDNLLRALGVLRRHAPELLLLIGGSGSLRNELESLSASLDLRGHVRFLGYIPEAHLPLYYQAADAFVLPTRELEGFGLITLEALACGTPVLGTPVGATPEILLPLDPALVFREATPEAMAEDLRRFLDAHGGDPVPGRGFRMACRRYVESHFSWDISVSRLEATLRDLALAKVSRPGRAGPP